MGREPFKLEALPPEIPWEKLVQQISIASSSIAKYSARIEGLINPKLLLAPLTVNEAVLSSRIEGTQATYEEVLEFEADPSKVTPNRSDIEEVINYQRAIRYAEKELAMRPMCVSLIKETHSILLDGVRGESKGRGEIRRVQNWIGPPGSTLENASYVPPSPVDLPESLSNLEKYYHSDEKDLLVQLALIHAQFELIHPFLDGNGRLGRILIPLFLYEKGVIHTPAFHLSEYIEANRQEYYSALNSISSDNNWLSWLSFFLDAVIWQAGKSGDRVRSILSLYKEMEVKVAETTRSQFAPKILSYIFSRPIFSGTDLSGSLEIKKATSSRLLRSLLKANILQELRPAKGRKSGVYRFGELLELIHT